MLLFRNQRSEIDRGIEPVTIFSLPASATIPSTTRVVNRTCAQTAGSGRAALPLIVENRGGYAGDAARSRSASGKTIAGDLPPSSRDTRFRFPAAADLLALVAEIGADKRRGDQHPRRRGIDRAQARHDRGAGQRHPGRKLGRTHFSLQRRALSDGVSFRPLIHPFALARPASSQNESLVRLGLKTDHNRGQQCSQSILPAPSWPCSRRCSRLRFSSTASP